MRLSLAFVLMAFLTPAQAAEPEGDPALTALFPEETPSDLNEFLWIKRPLVVFSDSPDDPRFLRQMELLQDTPDTLVERDVVVFVDTDPADKSGLREALRPRGFVMLLIAKDGTVILRKPFPWSARELSRTIDKQPLRLQEIRE